MNALFDVRLVTLFECVPSSRSRALHRIGNWNRAEVAPFPPEGKIHATLVPDTCVHIPAPKCKFAILVPSHRGAKGGVCDGMNPEHPSAKPSSPIFRS